MNENKIRKYEIRKYENKIRTVFEIDERKSNPTQMGDLKYEIWKLCATFG